MLLAFPMDFPWHILPSENHISTARAERKLTSGLSTQTCGDISGVWSHGPQNNVYPPNYIHSSQLRNAYVLSKRKASSVTSCNSHSPLIKYTQQEKAWGAQKTFPHSRESLPLVHVFLWQTPYETGSASDWGLWDWGLVGMLHADPPNVTEASSVPCPAFNPSVPFQSLITHRFLSALCV